jgi:hypothetical protein
MVWLPEMLKGQVATVAERLVKGVRWAAGLGIHSRIGMRRRKMKTQRVPVAVLAAFFSLFIGAVGASAADSQDGQHGHDDGHHRGLTCSGGSTTPSFSPSIIHPGTYSSITVTGICAIPSGTVKVRGDLTIKSGASLIANFPAGPGGQPPEGDAILNVEDNVHVGKGATLILGCAPSFGCTTTTTDRIGGDLIGDHPLGVLLHGDTIAGDVSIRGGGGQDYDCSPQGALFSLFKSPVYTTLEDSSVGGDVSVSGYQSCWLGLARTKVRGDVQFVKNALGDPDAIEILSNTIKGDLSCRGNQFVDTTTQPPVFTAHGPWDSTENANGDLFPRQPQLNTVKGERSGQCVLSSPLLQGGPAGPGPF